MALVRPVVDRLAEGLATHVGRSPVDVALARRQHAAYRTVLADAGWEVREVPAAPDHPDSVFVGRGGRTNGAGVRELRALLAPLGRVVVPVELRSVLHLKSAVTALPDCTLVGWEGLIDPSPLPTWRSAPEAAGAHVVLLGGSTVLMAASAPRTAEWLAGLGFDVVAVDITEFEKLEGCVTCLSVLVPRP